MSAGIISGATDALKSLITLSEKAIFHHGGTFTDLFGDLESNVVSVPNELESFSDVDLREDNFLKTGIDPFFDASRDVFFILYTNENRDGQEISTTNIGNTTFNESDQVRVLIHGYLGNYTSAINVKITKAYLDEGSYNVVGF